MNRPRTQYKKFKVNHRVAKSIIQKSCRQKRDSLLDLETFELLNAYGFPMLPMKLCKDAEEACVAAEKIGYPVVIKVSSPDILHKIDVGGVRLNLNSKKEVEKAVKELFSEVRRRKSNADIRGVLVQKMAEKGREVILGLKRDPQFGPILMFGLGGTYVEVMKDVTFRIAPIRELGTFNMIRSIKSYKILEGVRGEKPADMKKIAECIARLSQLAVECPEIEELDINPLLVYDQGKGCAVLDARILLSK